MKDDLLKIINHYGVMPQLKYFQSEIFELNEAIIQYENSGWDFSDEDCRIIEQKYRKHIAEEISDVEMMLDQFKGHYDIPQTDIDEIKLFKANRQLERIENETK